METDPTVCYRALVSRDARFDGRFFTGVTSTGIYCRPICPARTPRARNCRFFPCAAAAEAAGYRPCRRCHPESAPGTPAWTGPSAVLSRALRLIAAGALERGSVEQLANRLGLGSRHLRRLFRSLLGVSPRAIEQHRRLGFARQLMDQTRMPLSRVAISAGFSSVRRFNAAFRNAYHETPAALRGHRARGLTHRTLHHGAPLLLQLDYRPAFDWSALVAFLGPRALPGVEQIDHLAYRRAVALDGQTGLLEVRPLNGTHALQLSIPSSLGGQVQTIVRRIRDLFDLDADPAPVVAHLRIDPRLREAIRRRPGLRVPGCWDRFELAVRAILGQQITVSGATTLAGRLVKQFGIDLGATEPGPGRLFPSAERLAGADLASIGLPRKRAVAIGSLARAVAGGDLSLDTPTGLDEAVARLRLLPGVGEWTAQYIAMRAFREPDAFPASDLALRKAVATPAGRPTAGELKKIAAGWRPWRAYAALHLWMTLADRGVQAA